MSPADLQRDVCAMLTRPKADGAVVGRLCAFLADGTVTEQATKLVRYTDAVANQTAKAAREGR